MSLDHQASTAFRYLASPLEAGPLRSGQRSPGAEALRRLLGVGPGQVTGLLFRQVATPNYEMRRFLGICRRNHWRPVVLTYHADLMSCHNDAKRALIHLRIVEGIGKGGIPIWRRFPLMRLEEVETQPFDTIRLAGHPLVDLHTKALQRADLPTPERVEGSDWFKSWPEGARGYYHDLMDSLGDGLVLVEDFITEDRREAAFCTEIVEPAFAEVVTSTGRVPPIARLTYGRRVNSPLWYAYPASDLAHFRAAGAPL